MSDKVFDRLMATALLVFITTACVIVLLIVLQGTIGRPERVCYTPTKDGIPIAGGTDICTIIRVL